VSPDGTYGSTGAGRYGYRCPAPGTTNGTMATHTCCSAAYVFLSLPFWASFRLSLFA
jgi:hypothetical protein